MRKTILTSRVTITEVSTGCRFNDWEWHYRGWLPVWLQRLVIVRPLWKRHKRNCVRADYWRERGLT